MVTWYSGKKEGLLISFASALSWLVADVMMGNRFSNVLIPYINEFLRFIVFLFITYLIIYIDIDNFKNINDSMGHETGDQLLCVVSNILSKNIRSFDALARLGGDEFVILLSETDYNAADIACRKLQNTSSRNG